MIKTEYDGKGTTQLSVKQSDNGPLQVLSSKAAAQPEGSKS